MARILGTAIVGLNAKCCRDFRNCVHRYDQLWSSPADFKAVCMINPRRMREGYGTCSVVH